MLPSRSRWFLPLGSVANRDAVRKLGKNDELFPLHFSVPGLALVGSSVVRKSLCYSVPCFAEDPCFPQGGGSDVSGSKASSTQCSIWDVNDQI